MVKAHREMSGAALDLVAARFKVLGEASRLRILNHLRAGEMSVSEIVEAVEMTQPNASKHLKILHDTGLIARRQHGATVYYAIADDTVFKLCDVVCSSLHWRLEAQAGVFRRNANRRPQRSRR
jgi:ArsR family transcriptional regulator